MRRRKRTRPVVQSCPVPVPSRAFGMGWTWLLVLSCFDMFRHVCAMNENSFFFRGLLLLRLFVRCCFLWQRELNGRGRFFVNAVRVCAAEMFGRKGEPLWWYSVEF